MPPAAGAPCYTPSRECLKKYIIKNQTLPPSWWIRGLSPEPLSVFLLPAWGTPWQHGSKQSPATIRSPKTNAAGLGTFTGLNLARLCYDTLLQYGAAARISAQRQIITPALERIVEANILLSGVGFESGGLASAHSIHNGFTALEETHAYYHGEKVAFGVLAGLQLTDAPPEESDAVFSFCEEVGLPTTLADIGIGGSDRKKLMPVAEKACFHGEYIHHEAGEITPEKVLNAILAADATGEYRKNLQRRKSD